ncbi:MAG TPA: hydroxysqualene dehydroxylase HpnE, partial [Candidatus Polarisedimenticolia bacterium]|nr:hydroxysqualene dehydroxylase HpnE [Candidatus Polarisedimenticolia bacterium]
MTTGTGKSPDAIVVGGGFAGLAAATHLVQEGARLLLLEAKPHLGGRARSWVDSDTGSIVDNGQHLFMGCYRETLRFLERIGSLDRLHFDARLRVPLLDPGGGMSVFALPPLPAFSLSVVAGLLRYPGLSLRQRLGLLRVGRAVHRGAGRAPSTEALDERSVESWLGALGQGSAALDRLWNPLAIATLNEEPARASAAMFLPVLREVLAGGASGSRLGVARVGLSDLYADPAAQFLRARGSEVRLRAPVRELLVQGRRCTGVLLPNGERLTAPHVIAAVPPADLLEMLPSGIAADPYFSRCARLETSPIVSIYLWFGSPVTDLPFAGLIGGQWQWLFNRHAFAGRQGPGHGITLVRSAARAFVEAPRDVLVRRALDDLHRFV